MSRRPRRLARRAPVGLATSDDHRVKWSGQIEAIIQRTDGLAMFENGYAFRTVILIAAFFTDPSFPSLKPGKHGSVGHSMTVLVTGGAGCIGSHMVHALVDAGDRLQRRAAIATTT